MTTDVIPVRERLRANFIRNGLIAVVGASVLAMATSRSPRPVHWMARQRGWIAGVAFIVIDLVVHTGLTARGEPNLLNGRG